MIVILKSFNGYKTGSVVKFNDTTEALLVEKGLAKYKNDKKVLKKKNMR